MPAVPALFEPEPASVGAARRYAVGALQASTARHLQHDVRMVVSELATNAVLHARTPFTITVLADVTGVRVAVTDASRTRPRLPRRGDLSDTTGRGLRIVAQLSADWGVDVHDDGKTTWCFLPAAAGGGPAARPQEGTPPPAPAPTVDGAADRRHPLPDGRTGGASPAAGLSRPDQHERAVAA